MKDKMVIALLQRLFESFRTKKQARPSWGRMAATSQPSNIEDMDYFEFMYQETPGMKEDWFAVAVSEGLLRHKNLR